MISEREMMDQLLEHLLTVDGYSRRSSRQLMTFHNLPGFLFRKNGYQMISANPWIPARLQLVSARFNIQEILNPAKTRKHAFSDLVPGRLWKFVSCQLPFKQEQPSYNGHLFRCLSSSTCKYHLLSSYPYCSPYLKLCYLGPKGAAKEEVWMQGMWGNFWLLGGTVGAPHQCAW